MCIRVESVNVVTNVRLSGKLTLVDLAGSERVAQSGVVGARMQETQVYHMHPRVSTTNELVKYLCRLLVWAFIQSLSSCRCSIQMFSPDFSK